MSNVPPRILIAGAVSVVAVVVLAVAWLVGRGGSTDTTTASTTTASTTTAAPAPVDTMAPTPISVLPDWYKKGSSRYDERRPVTVPAERSVTSVPQSTVPTASSVPPASPNSTVATGLPKATVPKATVPKPTATTVPARSGTRTQTTVTTGTGR